MNSIPWNLRNYVMAYLGTIAISVISLYAGQSGAADVLPLADDSTIVVSADEAWEDAAEDVLHFRGHFEIRTPRWQLSAYEATIYGNLGDPQRVLASSGADGTLVQFFFRGKDAEGTEGEGQSLEFRKDLGLLTLSGDAKLTSGARVMRSSEIQYDLEKQELNAGGAEGVHVTVDPDGSEPNNPALLDH